MNETHKKSSEENSVEKNLSEGYISKSKLGGLPISSQVSDAVKNKAQKELEKFKEDFLKKFKFAEGIGVVPAQANKKIEEEYEISEEDSKRNLIHVLTVIPEKHFKDIGKIRLEAINIARKVNEKFWVHVLTSVDLWNLGLDSKFDVLEAFAMSYPALDKGILSALRVSQIHKSLVLRKFEKYVTSYVISGSLTRGEATKTSDVDVFIVIDDTDVKKMSRLELKEKLRSIIHTYIQEAQAIAGVKNILNVQMYLLTEFWDSVKDAHPVMFTFIRDGIPLYDRGAFLPWKSLLRMGKIKPSPEAIDMFMSSGNRLEENINRRILDIAVIDIYWGVLTPSQGILMLFGLAPPTPKETIKLIREVFYEKEKILEEKYVKIIEDIVQYYKGYEHGKNKKLTGAALDEMSKNALDYMKRLRKLREEIEKRVQEKSINKTCEDLFEFLGSILKKKTEKEILKAFDKEFVKEGKFPPRFLENLNSLLKLKEEVNNPKPKEKTKEGKKEKTQGSSTTKRVENARKHAAEITTSLIEYSQRKEFSLLDKTRFIVKGRDFNAEVFFLKNTFLIKDQKIQKITDDSLKDSDIKELEEQLRNHKNKEVTLDFDSLETLRKIFGDFKLVQ